MPRKKSTKADIEKSQPVLNIGLIGHVDHGKTTLLDKILKTNTASKEFGGITQHISAYQVKRNGKYITFLDTPGHEAFQAMRQRGAFVTDLAVIVVAADDGVKSQTKEAVEFARIADIPILVAINKIDKPEANIEKTKKELAELDLVPEEWGGKTIFVSISAKTGEGIDELLDMILLISDMEDLRADANSAAEGFVIESHLDSKIGPVATAIVQNGSLKEGDYINVGSVWGKVRKIEDFIGRKIRSAQPSTPVTITGLNKIPKVGSYFSAKKSRLEAESSAKKFLDTTNNNVLLETKTIGAAKINELVELRQTKKVNVVLKGDTQGSIEAISQILKSITPKDATIQILKTSVGNITENDIKLFRPLGAKIIGFNVGIDSSAKSLIEKEKADIKIYKVIYELVNGIKEDICSILEPEIIRIDLGILKVIAIFKSCKKLAKTADMIIGARVESGKIEKSCLLDVSRDGKKIGEGIVKNLQYNKKNVQEVKVGNNAGITYEGNIAIEIDDVLNAYKTEERMREIQ